MRVKAEFNLTNVSLFKKQLLSWLNNHDHCYFFDSHSAPENNFNHPYQQYDLVAAAGSLDNFELNQKQSLNTFDRFLSKAKDWYFGYISYDLKNHIENLTSDNINKLNWPTLSFIRPKYVFELRGQQVYISIPDNLNETPEKILQQILKITVAEQFLEKSIEISARMSKNDYLQAVTQLKNHIHRGDIYEVNFCQEFYAKAQIAPSNLFLKLSKISPSPFSAYLRENDNYLLSASPERFIKRVGDKIITQPIKGTAPRGRTREEDKKLAQELQQNPKERSENIMIVDLVRNDLSKIAKSNTVNVEELCKIYSFPQVHQMISTISGLVDTNSFTDILKATFPMGSMTGAPKIMAMKLAEQYENSRRGLYSGSVGYIAPNGDFDFNVIIRSIQYNHKENYLSYMVGSAITALSDPESEYRECLLKASAIDKVLGKTDTHA